MTISYIPSTPDPETVTIIATVIRWIFTLLSGLGIGSAAISDKTSTLIASALVGIAMGIWSLYEKYRAARLDHFGSVRSVVNGTPMRAT